MSSRVIDPPLQDKTLGLQWALKPIVLCMRISGVWFHFDARYCYRFADWLAGLVMLVLNVGLNMFAYTSVLLINNYDFDSGSFNSTTSLKSVIDCSNYVCFNMVSHWVVIFSVRFKWCAVVETLLRIERRFGLRHQRCLKLRKDVLVGLLFLIPVNHSLHSLQ